MLGSLPSHNGSPFLVLCVLGMYLWVCVFQHPNNNPESKFAHAACKSANFQIKFNHFWKIQLFEQMHLFIELNCNSVYLCCVGSNFCTHKSAILPKEFFELSLTVLLPSVEEPQIECPCMMNQTSGSYLQHLILGKFGIGWKLSAFLHGKGWDTWQRELGSHICRCHWQHHKQAGLRDRQNDTEKEHWATEQQRWCHLAIESQQIKEKFVSKIQNTEKYEKNGAKKTERITFVFHSKTCIHVHNCVLGLRWQICFAAIHSSVPKFRAAMWVWTCHVKMSFFVWAKNNDAAEKVAPVGFRRTLVEDARRPRSQNTELRAWVASVESDECGASPELHSPVSSVFTMNSFSSKSWKTPLISENCVVWDSRVEPRQCFTFLFDSTETRIKTGKLTETCLPVQTSDLHALATF